MPVKAGVVRAGARTTRRGAAETFTGVVFQGPVITAGCLSGMSINAVRHQSERTARGYRRFRFDNFGEQFNQRSAGFLKRGPIRD